MKEFWNDRYRQDEYVYGENPNAWLESILVSIPPGKILFPAEGEGRNAVFAAHLGWQVDAFDYSVEARTKALRLAEKKHVSIHYQVTDLADLEIFNVYDAIGLFYAHFAKANRFHFHQKLAASLKKDGLLLLEGFSLNHRKHQLINEHAGGPRDPELLYTLDEIRHCFPDFTIERLEETETELAEGSFHRGPASVIRFVGRKK